MNSTFVKAATRIVAPPNPYKCVNYTQGMLLGVDDFIQEHTYLAEHIHWLTRELLGYGTVSGLHISTDLDEQHGPRVFVSPGVAISPHGQMMRVASAQCASLNDWFALNKQELYDVAEGAITLYVVLNYCATPSDNIPVAGEAGRYAETLMLPSRLSDDFHLDLRLKAPDQCEEEAMRRFVAWLRQVRVSSEQEDSYSEPAHLLEALRKAVEYGDTHASSAFMAQPPPTDLVIPAKTAVEYWRQAFFYWTTALRPRWRQKSQPEDGILLAKLQMRIKQSSHGNWEVVMPEHTHYPVSVHEDERPYLLHTRLLQEWLLAGPHQAASIDLHITEIGEVEINEEIQIENASFAIDGDVTGATNESTTVQGLQQVPIAAIEPAEGQVLTFTGEQWQPADLPSVSVTNYVERSQELGSYTILAAGQVKCDGTSAQPTYNELVAQAHMDGQVIVRFKEYVRPKQTPYIVNVLPVWHQKIRLCSVFLGHFDEEFFTLHIVNMHGDEIRLNDLKQLELNIEIKQYNIIPPAPESTQSRRRKR